MIDSRILVGIVAVLISISTLIIIAVNEPDRQAEFKGAFAGRSVETGAGLYEEFCSPCHGDKGQGIEGRAPNINSQYFFSPDGRRKELNYLGTMDAYITLTIAGGRPAQSTSGPWAENMPTWSVDYGGPLRNDQIDSIADYILSWEEYAPDLNAEPTPIVGNPEERGEALFSAMGCVGCHMIDGEGGAVGPDLTGVVAAKGEDYVRQSIIAPNAVIADGYTEGIMPQNFGERMSDEQISDIITYLTVASE